MSQSCQRTHETSRARDLSDLRTAAHLIAIERGAHHYLALGIFP